MKVLVLNAGSSSLKYQLLNTKDHTILAKGVVEKIGFSLALFSYTNGAHDKVEKEIPLKDHDEALRAVFSSLSEGEKAVISQFEDIDAIGHRVVHGGDVYAESVIVDDKVIQELEKLCELAPLHNPANIMGIKACQKIVQNIKQVVVFDTSFHQTMKPHVFMYPIPYEYYEKYRIRRYGFHGTSYSYVAPKAAELLGKKIEDTNLIVCHIGNGASVAAIRGGKSVDTSMGFTPLDGLMMGTRCGAIDPAIILFLMEKEGLTTTEISSIINKESGLKGISGVSSDMRDVEAAADSGNQKAQLAVSMLVHSIRKIVGSYLVELNGKVDAIVFTAGMGEFDVHVRAGVTQDLLLLGIELDADKNRACYSKLADISTKQSKIKILVVPTNEELMIALDTARLIG